jgi:hypothetical protein
MGGRGSKGYRALGQTECRCRGGEQALRVASPAQNVNLAPTSLPPLATARHLMRG